MKKDMHITETIFRKFPDGDIIALFPGVAGSNDVTTCESYMHMGQHGAASVGLGGKTIKMATEGEYAPLKRELEGLGYNIKVIKRFTPAHLRARIKQVRGV